VLSAFWERNENGVLAAFSWASLCLFFFLVFFFGVKIWMKNKDPFLYRIIITEGATTRRAPLLCEVCSRAPKEIKKKEKKKGIEQNRRG